MQSGANIMWNNNTIEDEIQRNSLEYGVAVNSDRAIPDAKSGLKPVARRIIYDMFVYYTVCCDDYDSVNKQEIIVFSLILYII